MKIKKALTFLVLFLCIVVLIIMTACGPATKPATEEKVLKLGCIMPFSGPAAMYGEKGRQITDVYIDQINADGGIKIGNDIYKVSLSWGDDQFARPRRPRQPENLSTMITLSPSWVTLVPDSQRSVRSLTRRKLYSSPGRGALFTARKRIPTSSLGLPRVR